MTTERATPPAGFDTHAEVRRMTEAGLSEEQGAAMIYAAIAAADARNAELRKESEIRYAELRKESDTRYAELRKESETRYAEISRESDASYADLRKDMAHMGTRIRLWIVVSAGGGVIATVTLLQFLRNWPG